MSEIPKMDGQSQSWVDVRYLNKKLQINLLVNKLYIVERVRRMSRTNTIYLV